MSESRTKIDKLQVAMGGLLPTVRKFIETWRPPKLKGEVAFRDHLYDYLRQSVPDDANVEKEYRHRGTTMDLWLGWKGILQRDEIAFELKVNLRKKTDFDRLIGQIEGLDPKSHKVIVVLVGDTDPALLDRVTSKYRDLLAGELYTEASLAIVKIPIGAE